MDERSVVTCFLRNGGAVLLLCRSDAVGSYRGRWGAVAGHAEGDPEGAAREEIREEAGLDPDADVTLVRRGEPFKVVDDSRGTRWEVHPYLFDCRTREVTTNCETDRHEWVAPTAIRHRETVPDLWLSYDRVRPTVETVADDSEHGSASISVRALEVLRDEAAVARDVAGADGWDRLADLTRSLRRARPSMPVVENRLNRVMHAASDHWSPVAVEHAATAGIDEARHADERAAMAAARRLSGGRIATLSRSGTVSRALAMADPEGVIVAESRPGREGVGVAESLAAETSVVLTSDAAFASAVAEFDASAVLVGADAVLADGSVVNKAGTRAAAAAGTCEGVEVVVAAASDKLTPDERVDLEERDPGELYDGDADLTVSNPTFDVTPPECVDCVVTEQGVLEAADVADVVAGHRRRGRWSEE